MKERGNQISQDRSCREWERWVCYSDIQLAQETYDWVRYSDIQLAQETYDWVSKGCLYGDGRVVPRRQPGPTMNDSKA